MPKILHLADVHLGSGLSHGRINPETGLNTRIEDFTAALRSCVDRALAEPVDLVLFGGDAFPDATPPPHVQQAFAGEFRRLVDAGIPAVLLVGNHDQYAQGGGSASLSLYRTLGIPGVTVGDAIATHRLSTRSGDVQVITLPWLTRSALLARPETEGLSLPEVNELLVQRLRPVLEAEIRRLDPQVPAVLLGHVMADRASLGAERFLAVGKGFTLPVELFARPELDYVALGHVHCHQNLNPSNDPPIIYPGSIERVDFSEERERKGYVLLELEKGRAAWEFCPLSARPFRTIEVDVSECEDPQAALLAAIGKQSIANAVVRLSYKLRPEQLEAVDNAALHEALASAHSHTIRPQPVSQLARPRVPELGVGTSLDPLEALKTYVANRDDLQDISQELLAAAQTLLEGEADGSAAGTDTAEASAEPSAQGQLPLL